MFSLSRVVVDDGTFRDRAERISLLSLVLFFFFFFFAQRERERERERERLQSSVLLLYFFYVATFFVFCVRGTTFSSLYAFHEEIFLKLDAVDVIRSATFSASWRAEKAERERSVSG